MKCHTLKGNGGFLDKAVGAMVISVLLTSMSVGPFVPIIGMLLMYWGMFYSGLFLFLAAAFTFLPMKENVFVCRLVMQASKWFDKGVTVVLEESALEAMEVNDGSMWCMHPHGTALGFGFLLNGALRFKAMQPDQYLPEGLDQLVSPERLAKASGIQAPVLFRLPFVRAILLSLGVCTPATKQGIFGLFRKRSDFGLMPGGMEEVSIYKKGEDRVFIRKRAGFIKYALQHGYLLQLAYTFGECDLYDSMAWGHSLRMWGVKKYGFVAPVFWGDRWWCPLLPRSDVALSTVVGNTIQLPRIDSPTNEEVAHWHRVYMEQLKDLYERNKARFGYQSRSLHLM